MYGAPKGLFFSPAPTEKAGYGGGYGLGFFCLGEEGDVRQIARL